MLTFHEQINLVTTNHHNHTPYCHFLLVAGCKSRSFSLKCAYNLGKEASRTLFIFVLMKYISEIAEIANKKCSMTDYAIACY
jgi:hypothetical protein